MYIKYNDFELLYLIEEGSEEAYNAMVYKYQHLINQKIKDFRIKPKYKDDYIQEGLIVLDEAIRNFNEYKGKTFTMYFSMLLTYRFQRLLDQEKKYFYNVTLVEFPEMIKEEKSEFEVDSIRDKYKDYGFSELELEILNFISQGYKPIEIAKAKKIECRKVYNTISRIKTKIKNKTA